MRHYFFGNGAFFMFEKLLNEKKIRTDKRKTFLFDEKLFCKLKKQHPKVCSYYIFFNICTQNKGKPKTINRVGNKQKKEQNGRRKRITIEDNNCTSLFFYWKFRYSQIINGI